MQKKGSVPFFERFANKVTQVTGSSMAFVIAASLIVIWAISGPLFHYSENWQLVVNTGTTIVTFLMVFLIQKSQNKDSKAIQLKLNELIAATKGASNRLVDAEDMNEEKLDELHKLYVKIAELTASKKDKAVVATVEKEIDKDVNVIEGRINDIEKQVDDLKDTTQEQ
ncbi:MAG TPA: low affinity iron permease family protein [Niabella sp.]